MPVLDCGCNIIVGVMSGTIILQAEYCPLHGAAGELRGTMRELVRWADDTGNLLGMTIDQVAEFRECLSRAKTALMKADGAIPTRPKGDGLE